MLLGCKSYYLKYTIISQSITVFSGFILSFQRRGQRFTLNSMSHKIDYLMGYVTLPEFLICTKSESLEFIQM